VETEGWLAIPLLAPTWGLHVSASLLAARRSHEWG